MFGLRNTNGSCWINATLQAIFRIPDLQKRFDDGDEDDKNPVETCLSEIWSSKGDEGLKAFYQCVKISPHMPAGESIGDSHELIEYLLDTVPFLDKLMRFRVAHAITCSTCKASQTRTDTLTEFSLAPTQQKQTVSDAILEAVQPVSIEDWKCDACASKGCTKQLLLAEFPRIMMFHQTSIGTTVTYTPILVVNNMRYALMSIVCFTGGHWFTWGRNIPPGQPWYRLDDGHVQKHSAKFFPLADNVRLLLYYRLNE
jgi:ubiquitin C-terminal hydrolase